MSAKIRKNEYQTHATLSKHDALLVMRSAGVDTDLVTLPESIYKDDSLDQLKSGITVDVGRKIGELVMSRMDDVIQLPLFHNDRVSIPVIFSDKVNSRQISSAVDIGLERILLELVKESAGQKEIDAGGRKYSIARKVLMSAIYAMAVFGVIVLISIMVGHRSDSTQAIQPGAISVLPPLPLSEVQRTETQPQAATQDKDAQLPVSPPAQMIKPITSLESVMGKTDNPSRKLFVFSDPTCPYCKRLEPVLEKLAQSGYEVHVFPTPIHQESLSLVRGIACAANKALSWHDAISTEKQSPLCDSEASKTANEDALGFFRQFGFNATPTLINSTGFTHVGAMSESELIAFAARAK